MAKSRAFHIALSVTCFVCVILSFRFLARSCGGFYSRNHVLNYLFNGPTLFSGAGYILCSLTFLAHLSILLNTHRIGSIAYSLAWWARGLFALLTISIVTYGLLLILGGYTVMPLY